MLSTKIDIESIPTDWIFETYCELSEPLNGLNIKIISVFNTGEKTPSFWIYPYNNNYRFWDFSSGLKGTALQFVMIYFDLDEKEAIYKIYNDYKGEYVTPKSKKTINYTPFKKVKLKSFKIRNWTKLDAEYWLQFKIGKNILEKYKIFPISELILEKESKILKFKKPIQYGYFKKDGTLYKIYEPYNKKNKFLTFARYIQGMEQLEYKKENLLINSSLKDILSTDFLKLNFEYIAPPSENTLIDKEIMISLKYKYNNIYTLFDNDKAGIKATNKYKEMYNTKPLYLENFSKDISDSLKDFKPILIKNKLKEQI